MKIWKTTLLSIIAISLIGCVTKPKPVAVVYPPLLIADASPIISSSKHSVGVKVNFENIASADLSYARFKLTAYDSAGISVNPKKGNRKSAYVRLAGPISPGKTQSTTWSNTWKNKDIQCISLDEVELIYIDGSGETATGTRLLSNNSGQNCLKKSVY